jgi:hypothetical protein
LEPLRHHLDRSDGTRILGITGTFQVIAKQAKAEPIPLVAWWLQPKPCNSGSGEQMFGEQEQVPHAGSGD